MIATVRKPRFLSLIFGLLVTLLAVGLVMYVYSYIMGSPRIEEGNTQILPQIQDYTLKFAYRDPAFEQKSGVDAALAYAYMPIRSDEATIWVGIEVAQNTSVLHRWETSLVNDPLNQGLQPNVTSLDLRDIQIQDYPPIVARYFAFQDRSTNQTQVVLYWYEAATFNFNGTLQQKQIKMSLVSYPHSKADVPAAENQLLPFAKTISNYWQSTKIWTTIALTIIVATSALLVIVAARLFWRERQA